MTKELRADPLGKDSQVTGRRGQGVGPAFRVWFLIGRSLCGPDLDPERAAGRAERPGLPAQAPLAARGQTLLSPGI